ncbi:hypothetical protein BCR44DRAFT_53046 [Catenaria anguillulae PL171]|uniref:Uncharacterized protein n=1 Tax=Catenaria anguillulae PL171 TaxID=765915 RepID=A0A1Y2HD17_9FUNG|nr:hypothetical protein BCR44DRAFT_53046 [Catenaria anguillulae PL171]
MCVPSPSSSSSTCRLIDRLAASTPAQPPIIEQPTNPTSDPSNASDGTLSALASPILWAQLTAIILASILLLGWSRGGIEWRKRVQARLVRCLARVQPSKSTVVRELACDPADNRMLASYRPRQGGRRRRDRGTRAMRVRYLPDGTPEWIEERVDEDEPLPLYVPPSPPEPAVAASILGVPGADNDTMAAAPPAAYGHRRSSLDPERALLLAHPSAAAAADIRRARRGSSAGGAVAVGSPRLSALLVGGPPPPPFGMPMPRPASLDSVEDGSGGSSSGSRRGSFGVETFEGIDEDDVDMDGGEVEDNEWRFGHR